ncbi:MAG: TIGR03987 family protein [Eubacterium sp.]|nr:TIGR03987 family protein [Eubacterium sp.]
MQPAIILAIVFIMLALIFYTIGVWWEKKDGILKLKHLVFFCLGLICDVTGTTAMSAIVGARSGSESDMPILLNAHGITGIIAIVLMVVHVAWAIAVLIRNRDDEKQVFHSFSFIVWCVWLVPFFIGMLIGMRG